MTSDAPYAADPLNPTDAELSAAIQRGLADGTLIDADDWLARSDPEPDPEPAIGPETAREYVTGLMAAALAHEDPELEAEL